jgi:aspartate aminotransferase
MTGWRVGYMGGPEDIIRAASRVQGQTTNNANSIAQKATVAALQGPQEPIRAMTAEFERRRDHVVRRLSVLRNATVPLPDGAMYAFFNVAGYFSRESSAGIIRSASDIARYLLDCHHVALVPGDAFGDPECVRLSFACSMTELEKGMDRIVRGFRELED